VQSLSSLGGASFGSSREIDSPLPSQTSSWQSPAFCSAGTTPAVATSFRQVPSSQTATKQGPLARGQSLTEAHGCPDA